MKIFKIFLLLLLPFWATGQEPLEFFPTFVLWSNGFDSVEEPLQDFKIEVFAGEVWFFGKKTRIIKATRSQEKIIFNQSFQTYISSEFNMKIYIVRQGNNIHRVIVDYGTTETLRIYTRKEKYI